MVTPFFKNIPILPLNDGYDMPQIGVASFRRDPEDKLREILLRNLDKGLRHVEICDLFGNGHTVADIILEGGAEIRRDKLFLTLKIWPKQRKRQDIILAFKEFLFGSNLEYVDLLMIHGPLDVVNRIEQYKAMEELKQEGFVRSIGLSNMTHTQLSNILKKCNICPAVIEMEITPFNQALEISEFCHDNAIVLLSDNPLAKDIYSDSPNLIQIAESLNITVQQMLVRWCISKGYAVLLPPDNERLGNDLKVLCEHLPIEALEQLDGLNEGLMTTWQTNEEGGDEG